MPQYIRANRRAKKQCHIVTILTNNGTRFVRKKQNMMPNKKFFESKLSSDYQWRSLVFTGHSYQFGTNTVYEFFIKYCI